MALLLSLPFAIAVALLAVDPPPAAAPPNPQPAPAPTEIEGPPSKTGPRPLLGVTPRPGQSSPELAKMPKDPAQRREWLKTQLDELFGAKAFANAKISAIVVDADSGKTLYAHAEKTALNAASNVKIVTSAAGLSLLGPEYRWRTTLSVVGPPSGPPLPASGEVPGDLYVRVMVQVPTNGAVDRLKDALETIDSAYSGNPRAHLAF